MKQSGELAMTFDDGLASTATNAAAILANEGHPVDAVVWRRVVLD